MKSGIVQFINVTFYMKLKVDKKVKTNIKRKNVNIFIIKIMKFHV